MIHLNNEMWADVAAGNKRGSDGRRREGIRFCSKTYREPWEALEQGRDGI